MKKKKTCRNCAYAIWNKTKTGKTKWSSSGRCIWFPKRLPLSIFPKILSRNRIESNMKDCPCWRDIKDITPTKDSRVTLLVYDFIEDKEISILVLKDDGKIYYLNNELFAESLRDLVVSNYVIRDFCLFNKNDTIIEVVERLAGETI